MKGLYKGKRIAALQPVTLMRRHVVTGQESMTSCDLQASMCHGVASACCLSIAITAHMPPFVMQS